MACCIMHPNVFSEYRYRVEVTNHLAVSAADIWAAVALFLLLKWSIIWSVNSIIEAS